eukprot:366567-Chlamydomonas_euryale.AAC.8
MTTPAQSATVASPWAGHGHDKDVMLQLLQHREAFPGEGGGRGQELSRGFAHSMGDDWTGS